MNQVAEAAPFAVAPPAFLASVDAVIERALTAEDAAAAASAGEARELVAEIARTVGAGGKRIRPALCYWGYRAGGGPDDPADVPGGGGAGIAQAGAAIELLHTAAIIHDDIVDGSLLRRGRSTASRSLSLQVAAGRADSERFGLAAAILAGDLAHTLADRMLASAPFPPERIVAAFEHFSRARLDAIHGEYLDLRAAQAGPAPATPVTEQGIRRIGALKAGSYTVVGPLLIGAALAGRAEPSVDAALRAFGEPLGEAFQLRDDVLGTFGERNVTGKDPDDDLREGKRTLLVAVALRRAEGADRSDLLAALGDPNLTRSGAERARAVIRGSGALEETLVAIDALLGQAPGRCASRTWTLRSYAPSTRWRRRSGREKRDLDPRGPDGGAPPLPGRADREPGHRLAGRNGTRRAAVVRLAGRRRLREQPVGEPGAPQRRARPARDPFDRPRQVVGELAGVLVRGRAEILHADEQSAKRAMSAWFEKYRSELGGTQFGVYVEQVQHPVLFSVVPDRVTGWSNSTMTSRSS